MKSVFNQYFNLGLLYSEYRWKWLKIPFIVFWFFTSSFALIKTGSLLSPSGACRLINCTILLQPSIRITLLLISLVATIFYIIEIKMLITTMVLSILSVVIFSMQDSQGIYNRNDILTGILIVQMIAYLIFYVKNSNELLNKQRIVFSQQIIIAIYFLSGLSKLLHSGLFWFLETDKFALQTFKANLNQFINAANPSFLNKADIITSFILNHPVLTSILLLLTLFFEVFAFVMLFINNKGIVLYACLLIFLHIGIWIFMSIIITPIVLMNLIFLVNFPYFMSLIGRNLFMKLCQIIPIGICLMMIGCTNSDKHKRTYQYDEHFIFSATKNTVQISNPHTFDLSFSLKINDFFPLRTVDVVKKINELKENENTSTELATWLFVTENSYHSSPFTDKNWQHNPLLFINSIGGGFCDDRASVLAQLWKEQGFNSRIIKLEGHVVPEVYSNGRWQMYDPDLDIFYCRADTVLSVSDIEISGDEIFQSSCLSELVNPVYLYKNPVSDFLVRRYVTKNDNIEVTKWHLIHDNYSLDFVLPSRSSIEFQYDEKGNNIGVRVILEKGVKGRLQIPLVPIFANGNFNVINNDVDLKIRQDSLFFPTNHFINSMIISDVKEQSEIIYLINQKLNVFHNGENNLKINASHPVVITQNHTNAPIFVFKEMRFFFDLYTSKYESFLKEISVYNEDVEINREFLIKQFSLFLSYDSISTPSEKQYQIKRFKTNVDNWMNMIPNGIIKNSYPFSVFYLFLISRYEKEAYLKELRESH